MEATPLIALSADVHSNIRSDSAQMETDYVTLLLGPENTYLTGSIHSLVLGPSAAIRATLSEVGKALLGLRELP